MYSPGYHSGIPAATISRRHNRKPAQKLEYAYGRSPASRHADTYSEYAYCSRHPRWSPMRLAKCS